MITADKIRKLAYLDIQSLEEALRRNYPKDRIDAANFVGITNAGEFCYSIRYYDEQLEEHLTTKVFVELGEDNEPVADY